MTITKMRFGRDQCDRGRHNIFQAVFFRFLITAETVSCQLVADGSSLLRIDSERH